MLRAPATPVDRLLRRSVQGSENNGTFMRRLLRNTKNTEKHEVFY